MKLQTRSFVVRKPETIDITAFFKKFCIATRTKIKAVDSLESTAFIILSTHFYSFFANQLSGNPLFTILQSHYKRYVMVTASIVPASG